MEKTVFKVPSKYNVGELIEELKKSPPDSLVRITIRMPDSEELIFMPLNKVFLDTSTGETDIDAEWKNRI